MQLIRPMTSAIRNASNSKNAQPRQAPKTSEGKKRDSSPEAHHIIKIKKSIF